MHLPDNIAYPGFSFHARSTGIGRSRLGELVTPHGTFRTPAFVFCATKGALKSVPTHLLHSLGVSVMLGNTYHLMLRPGVQTLKQFGGFSQFSGFKGPTLTDSGGFQIFSLGKKRYRAVVSGASGQSEPSQHAQSPNLVTLTDDGAQFRSVYDGTTHLLTPEGSIDIQGQIGADLILVLDECTDGHAGVPSVHQALKRTHEWSDRGLLAFAARDGLGSAGHQALYGIIQGGTNPHWRQQGIDYVNSRPFFGHAIGGTLGNAVPVIHQTIARASRGLNPERPLHLLGIGDLSTILTGVLNGVDTFDCVHPTRVARHGWALVQPSEHNPSGRLNLRNATFTDDSQVLEEACDAPCCTAGYSRGLIAHLLRIKEPLATTLLSIHNIRRTTRFMNALHEALSNGSVDVLCARWKLPVQRP